MFLRNDKTTTEKRKLLRKKQTPQEIILWSHLRNSKLGFKFKRQYALGAYILDFYCPRKLLCIEIDGLQHIENKGYDEIRTKFINDFGVKVLRFWNDEINNNLDSVLKKITTELNSPSPEVGEGSRRSPGVRYEKPKL